MLPVPASSWKKTAVPVFENVGANPAGSASTRGAIGRKSSPARHRAPSVVQAISEDRTGFVRVGRLIDRRALTRRQEPC